MVALVHKEVAVWNVARATYLDKHAEQRRHQAVSPHLLIGLVANQSAVAPPLADVGQNAFVAPVVASLVSIVVDEAALVKRRIHAQ